jgi:hypothetical protein
MQKAYIVLMLSLYMNILHTIHPIIQLGNIKLEANYWWFIEILCSVQQTLDTDTTGAKDKRHLHLMA